MFMKKLSGEKMSSSNFYCPVCGTMVVTEEHCPLCNYDIKSSQKISATLENEKGSSKEGYIQINLGSEKWQKIEPLIISSWSWLCLVTILIGIGLWIFSFIRLFQFRFGRLIYFLLNSGALLLVAMYFSLYNEKIHARNYHFLKNDAVTIGQIRIPKFLLVILGISIGLYWIGGILLLIPAILLIFLAPGQIQWRIDRILLTSSGERKNRENETLQKSPKKTTTKSVKKTIKKSAKKTVKKSTKKTLKKSTKKYP